MESGAGRAGHCLATNGVVLAWLNSDKEQKYFPPNPNGKMWRYLCGALAAHLVQEELTEALVTKVFQSKVVELVAVPVSSGVFLSS